VPKAGATRESHFPAIEKRYGEPMSHWHKVMSRVAGKTYPEQMAHLQENHGFSKAHANALVMFTRGSLSARRHATPTDWYKSVTKEQARTIRAIFKAVKAKYPSLELVIAWNQPMLRKGTDYILGASATKGYILINPFSKNVIDEFRPKLREYRVLKHTIALPSDWDVDATLIQAIAKARIAELKKTAK
jgi:uncharacterized protein YdhG (YjbR/CyaY superfamily)